MPTFRETDRPVLDALYHYRAQWLARRKPMEFARPMDLGGSSRSSHVPALVRLVVLGLAERRDRQDGSKALRKWRASYEYRISANGISKFEAEAAHGCTAAAYSTH